MKKLSPENWVACSMATRWVGSLNLHRCVLLLGDFGQLQTTFSRLPCSSSWIPREIASQEWGGGHPSAFMSVSAGLRGCGNMSYLCSSIPAFWMLRRHVGDQRSSKTSQFDFLMLGHSYNVILQLPGQERHLKQENRSSCIKVLIPPSPRVASEVAASRTSQRRAVLHDAGNQNWKPVYNILL